MTADASRWDARTAAWAMSARRRWPTIFVEPMPEFAAVSINGQRYTVDSLDAFGLDGVAALDPQLVIISVRASLAELGEAARSTGEALTQFFDAYDDASD